MDNFNFKGKTNAVIMRMEKEIENYRDELSREEQNLRTIEEDCARLESNLQLVSIEMRRSDRKIAYLNEQIQEKKQIVMPEKANVDSLEGFVKASKSIFAARVFQEQDIITEDQRTALIGKPGEVLMDLARISEKVLELKSNISILRRAQKHLEGLKGTNEISKSQVYFQSEHDRLASSSVLVRYVTISGFKDECIFPTVTGDSYKITFADLLIYACRYWNLFDKAYVLADDNYNIYPGSAPVVDEIESKEKIILLLSKEEAQFNKIRIENEQDPIVPLDHDRDGGEEETVKAIEMLDTLRLEEENLIRIKHERETILRIQRDRNRNVLNLLIYGLFLALYVWALFQPSDIRTLYYLRTSLRKVLLEYPFPIESSAANTFSDIYLQDDLKTFLGETFVNVFFDDTRYNGESSTEEERKYILYTDKILGQIRFLQKRVKNDSCDKYFSDRLGLKGKECFAQFNEENEYKEDIEIPEGVDSKYADWFKYTSVSDPRSLSGVSVSYELNGYMAFIEGNTIKQDAIDALDVIMEDWINAQTRLLLINANLCNQNIDICVSFELSFEFVPGGAVLPKENIYLFRVNRNWRTSDKLRIGFDITIAIIMVYFLVDLILRIRASGFRAVFSEIWSWFEVLLLLTLTLKHLAILYFENQDMIVNFDIDSTEYVDYMTVAYRYGLINNFEGISSFIALFSFLRFFKKSKSLKVIWGTLGESMQKMIFFFLVFSLVFIGWILLAHRGFGQYLYDYRNIGPTASTLLKILLGEVDYYSINSVQPEYAATFFFLFIALAYFVLLNIFLAIINEAYDTVYKQSSDKDERDELWIIIGSIAGGVQYAFLTMPYRLLTCAYCKRRPKLSQREDIESELGKYKRSTIDITR
jgi:hypothetical protein